MFDVPIAAKMSREWNVEVPVIDEDWQIGCIVGPSGSGKTTVACAAYGANIYQGREWPADCAVIDAFGEHSVKEISAALTAVGFSSPPSWVKPYNVLSNGEKFRCDLAYCLLSSEPLIVFDEFTSVVDRTVAKIGSAAIAKAMRRQVGRRFVAVTCHYDVTEWLEADWVLDLGTGQLARGRLRRPEIELEIVRCDRAAWRVFGPHHYLDSREVRNWRCFLATWQDTPVAMVCVLKGWGYKNYERISRIVVLPDYQGIGIARAVLKVVAQYLVNNGAKYVGITTGHPGMIHSLRRSGEWTTTAVNKHGSAHSGRYYYVNGKQVPNTTIRKESHSLGRCVVSFAYKTLS